MEYLSDLKWHWCDLIGEIMTNMKPEIFQINIWLTSQIKVWHQQHKTDSLHSDETLSAHTCASETFTVPQSGGRPPDRRTRACVYMRVNKHEVSSWNNNSCCSYDTLPTCPLNRTAKVLTKPPGWENHAAVPSNTRSAEPGTVVRKLKCKRSSLDNTLSVSVSIRAPATRSPETQRVCSPCVINERNYYNSEEEQCVSMRNRCGAQGKVSRSHTHTHTQRRL